MRSNNEILESVLAVAELIRNGDRESAKRSATPYLHEKIFVGQLLGFCVRQGEESLLEWLVTQTLSALHEPTSHDPESSGLDQLLRITGRAGQLGMVRFLVETCDTKVDTSFNGREQEPLSNACFSGNVELVRYLLERGANPNVFRPAAVSLPLIHAAHSGDLAMANVLIEHGAAVNGLNPFGLSPLSYALMKGDPETIAYLRSVGALEPWQIRGESGPPTAPEKPKTKKKKKA